MRTNDAPSRQYQLLFILALTAAAIMAYTAGAFYHQYNLLMRASEDAYASMLLRRADVAANQIQDLLSWLIDDMASLGHPAFTDTDQPAPKLIERLHAKYGALLLAAATYNDQGVRTAISTATNCQDMLPMELFKNFADTETLREKKQPWVLESPVARENHPSLLIVTPILNATEWQGAVAAVISISTLEKQTLAGLRDSDSALCWLAGTNRVLAGKAPEPWPLDTKAKHERELIMENIRPNPMPYAVVEINNVRRLMVFAPITLPDRTWIVGLGMLWNSVRLAPHALFKGSVILAAWALPLIAVLALFSIRALLLAVTRRERLALRQELDDAQAKLVAAIEAVQEAIFLTNPADPDAVAFVSHRIETITGHTSLELMADTKSWLRLIHPDDRDFFAQKRRSILQTGNNNEFSYRFKHRHGRWISLREYIRPIHDAAGKTTHILGALSATPSLHTTTIADGESSANTSSNNATAALVLKEQSKISSQPASLSPKPKIMLVDDDRLLVSLFTKALKRMGYGITGAYNGLQAVELYTANPENFDVIVLDMVMPKMSGLEAIQHLRKIRQDVRIIGISGYSADGKEWDLPRQGIHAFIAKPFEAEELAKTIDSIASIKESDSKQQDA